MRATLIILKKCLKINWFSAPKLYSAEARKNSQDGEFPTVTPFISAKLSHLMMVGISTAPWPIVPQKAPIDVLPSGEGHISFL